MSPREVDVIHYQVLDTLQKYPLNRAAGILSKTNASSGLGITPKAEARNS